MQEHGQRVKNFYATQQECEDVCASFPIGAVSDTAGNTVGCRTYHAGAPAMGNPDLHCPHASSYGGNLCGSYCEAYCNMSLTKCTAASGYPGMGAAVLNNYAECMAICPAFPLGDVFVDTTVNSLACRLYHSQAAIVTGLYIHCTHASPNGNNYCGVPCEAYCSIVNNSCAASDPAFASNAACQTYCDLNMQGFEGNWNDTGGDTVGCRIYHADAFLALGAPHCSHASASGGNTCGSWCQVYCDLIDENCVGNNLQYNGTSDCMTHCAGFSTAGNPGDTAGNTVQCRIYHAGVAGLDPATNPQIHCPHAGPTGGGVCVGAPPSTTTTAAATSGAAGTSGAATGATGAASATTGKSAASTVVASALLVIALIAVALL